MAREESLTEGIDIQVVLDVSGSMAAEDFQPRNRLAVAKDVMREFVAKRRGDRIGIVIFAGSALTRSPLTSDHRMLRLLLDSIELHTLPDGTAIGMALAAAAARLVDSQAATRVIVLVTEVLHGLMQGVPDLYRRVLALLLALGLVGWVSVARLVRGLILQAREEAWVEAARSLGVRAPRLLLRHILPNVSGPILVTATLRVPSAILAESIVSFIGLGIQPPFASWGVLANDGFAAMRSYPHLIVFPSLAILASLIGLHLLGEELRERLDPRRGPP